MRAYALAYPTAEARAYLQRKVREMIGIQAWRDNPSTGFLEAFDIMVYTRDRELTPQLADWVRRPDNGALAHAAYLALDRLVQAVDLLDTTAGASVYPLDLPLMSEIKPATGSESTMRGPPSRLWADLAMTTVKASIRCGTPGNNCPRNLTERI